MTTAAQWFEGARPRTLGAAVSPVLVGTAAGVADADGVIWWRFAAALAVALALQVGVNYANDYSDGVRGTDTERRGPLRLTATGTATPQAVRNAAALAFAVAAVIGLVLSLVVIRLVERPVGGHLTYGLRRAEVLSGQANGAVLLVLGVLVIYQAIWRLIWPPAVAGALVTIVAGVGVAFNVAAAWVIARANRQSLNVEGSFQHIITDLYAFIGTFLAGIVILFTGFDRADAIASLFVAALMIRSGFGLQRSAIRVLLESAPLDMVPTEVGQAMAQAAHVSEVHDLHVWELAPGRPILTAHVLVAPKVDCHAVRRDLECMLQERFRIAHTTLQVDHARPPLISITRRRPEPTTGT